MTREEARKYIENLANNATNATYQEAMRMALEAFDRWTEYELKVAAIKRLGDEWLREG